MSSVELKVGLVTMLGAGLMVTAKGAAPDFEMEIRPILETNCLRCHGAGKEKGGLRLHDRESMLKGGDTDAAIEEGNPDHSLLIERLMLPPEDDEVMPQEAEPLTAEEIEKLSAWVKAGAAWPEGMRLKAKKRKTEMGDDVLPTARPESAGQVAQAIDKVLAHENGDRDLLAASGISDEAFLRRATVDLIGRIPTVEEIGKFEKWPVAERRARLLSTLLEHPRFADRWTVFFADMLRVRSNVTGGRELLAWLHASIKTDEPWDRMAYELISANGRTSKNPAVGYVLGDDADPMSMASSVSQTFLGVRLACAQCHDHPFDDWEQKDFYEMASFFGKTQRVESRFSRSVYTTEGKEMKVLWPPEDSNPPKRSPVKPQFPFELVDYGAETPDFIKRFEEKRTAAASVVADVESGSNLDDLLDLDTTEKTGLEEVAFDVLDEAKKASANLKVENDLYRPSELRAELAGKVTDPRNPYFSRSFVNRIWAELNGRGFVEPLDNFSEYQATSHPQTLEYLSREFVASGYNFKDLLRTIMLTDTYARGHLSGEATVTERSAAEKAFTASPVRRLLAEALYDSVVVAGHLTDYKWEKGENVRVVTKQIRIPIQDMDGEEAGGEETPQTDLAEATAAEEESVMMVAANGGMAMQESAGAGYDLEEGIELDFDKVLEDAAAQEEELSKMREMADAKIEAERRARMAREAAQRRGPMRYRLETVEEKTDDNPKYASTLRMASPAAPDHFLRVFGQPSRAGLGEFRDHAASLRQELMMLNGKVTHEAARVGSLEPMHGLLAGGSPQLEEAIRFAYRECLTREPSGEELADGKMILEGAATPLDGMGDLRWALMNCHEFRFLP